MSKKSTYFVSGASGFVGHQVCRQLVDSGNKVKTLVRKEDPKLKEMGVLIWVGDLSNNDLLKDSIKDSDIVIHCAGDAIYGNGSHYYTTNTQLTEQLVNSISKYTKKCKRFIYISTIGAIDRAKSDKCSDPLTEDSASFPSSDYGKSKLQAENIVRNSNLPYSIVRPTMVVGNEMRSNSHFSVFAFKSLQNSIFARINWPGKFSVIHVNDLASAIIFIAQNPEAEDNTYFCAGEITSVSTFLKSCNPEVRRLPLTWILPFLKVFSRWLPFSLKAMLLPALTASDERLRNLGWKPKHTSRSALAEVINREKIRLNPKLSPKGQTVITGAASGLGLALVKYLAPLRDRVLLVDIDSSGLLELTNKYSNCIACVVDLSKNQEIDSFINSEEWNTTNITEIFACAGIGVRGRMQDITIESHRKMFTVNVLARIALVDSAIKTMQQRHFGRVVLISSSSAFQPLPYMASYAASNSALLSLGESWGAEVQREGIHIMTVCPGGMKTNFQKSSGVKEIEGETLIPPEQVVRNIMVGIQNQKSTLIVSFRSFAMSMLARFLPRKISVKLWFRLMEKMR